METFSQIFYTRFRLSNILKVVFLEGVVSVESRRKVFSEQKSVFGGKKRIL